MWPEHLSGREAVADPGDHLRQQEPISNLTAGIRLWRDSDHSELCQFQLFYSRVLILEEKFIA